MVAVTQRIPNFLGGISQVADSQKTVNQVKDCLNAWADPAFGLIKRPGGAFKHDLKSSGTVITPGSGTLTNAKWFSVFRDQQEKYLGAIRNVSGGNFFVWDINSGAQQTTAITGSASTYYFSTNPANDIEVLTINDYTFVLNKTKVVAEQATPSSWPRTEAFVIVRQLSYNTRYSVTIDATTVNYDSPVDQAAGTLRLETLINSLVTSLNGISGVTATAIGPGIHIQKTAAFSIKVRGGWADNALEAVQQSVPNISKLPSQCKHGFTVQVQNSSVEEDDYYVQFVADDGINGVGVWEECRSPLVSPGLDASTMPHLFVRRSDGVWEAQPITWEPRLVGDAVTNPAPSFVGQKINHIFFYKNRLGFLAGSNVIMSQPGDYFNFYAQSALTVNDSDPIDVTSGSTRPVLLTDVTPVAQGLVLHSSGEQLLLSGSTDVLTPSNVNIRTISSYQYNSNLPVVDLGTTLAFVARSPSYSRVYEMQTLGNDESPLVQDITKWIPEYIPSGITHVSGSGQSGLLALSSNTDRFLYLYQFYRIGDQRQTGWVRWQVSGNVTYHTIEDDVLWVITQQQGSFAVQTISLTQSPSTSLLVSADGSRVDPRLGLFVVDTPKSLVGTDTRIPLPFTYDSNRQVCVVLGNSTVTGPSYANAGRVYFPTVSNFSGVWNAVIPNEDLTAEKIIIGYTYDWFVDLPTMFYRPDNGITDFTAYHTVSRMKFNFGLTGQVDFLVRARGRTDWVQQSPVIEANYYLANDIPLIKSGVFTLPIYQRNDNFSVRVQSSGPWPASLLSMMWEGNYQPRFYQRKLR